MADEMERVLVEFDAEDNITPSSKSILKSLNNIEKAINNVSDAGERVDKGTSRAVSSMDKFENALYRVNSAARHYNSSMFTVNRSLINIVEGMGSAIYDFTSDSIDNFTEFSEQHAKTLGAMANNYDKTAESQRKFFEDSQKIKDQAKDLGTYGIGGQGALSDVTQVSELQTELIKSGLNAEDLTTSGATEQVLKFAQANDIKTSDAVEFTTALGNQFNIDPVNYGDMLDKVSHAADTSIVDVKDIVQSMKYAGGITSGLGRSMEETLGMVSLMGNYGLTGTQSGSGIQALITRLLTGDTTVITAAQKEVAPPKALEAFYDFEETAKPNGTLLPMTEVTAQLDSVMSTLNDEEQAWFAKKLFGLYQMKSAYALINGETTDLSDVINEITYGSSGTNDNKLSLILSSQSGKLTSLDNLWEGIKTDFGDRLSVFTGAVRDELFNYLKNPGTYKINFRNLQKALDDASDLISNKYGTAVGNAVRNLGTKAIDLTQVTAKIGPDLASGIMNMIGDVASFNVPKTIGDWNEMISDMKDSVKELPPDMRDLGLAVVNVIDMFGKLAAVNMVAQGTEIASNSLIILTTIADGMSVLIGLLGGIPGVAVAVGSILAIMAIPKAVDSVQQKSDNGATQRNVYSSYDNGYDYSTVGSSLTTGMHNAFNTMSDKNNIKEGSSVSMLLKSELENYVYDRKQSGQQVTLDEFTKKANELYTAYNSLINGSSGYYNISGNKLNSSEEPLGNDDFKSTIYKLDEYGNIIKSSATNVYDALNNYVNTGDINKSSEATVTNTTTNTTTTVDGSIQTSNNVVNTPAYDSDKYKSTSDVMTDSDTQNDEIKSEYKLDAWDKFLGAFRNNATDYGWEMDRSGDNGVGDFGNMIFNGSLNLWDGLADAIGAGAVKIADTVSDPEVWSTVSDMITDSGDYKKKTPEENKKSIENYNDARVNQIMANVDIDKIVQDAWANVDWTKAGGTFGTAAKDAMTGTIVNNSSSIANVMGGINAYADNSKENVIRNELKNNIVMNDNLTLTPQFNVASPTVNVSVKVDKDGNATTTKNILTTPNTASLLNPWYSRVSSQYGSTSK